MARKWYGSLNNRLEENRQFCEEIKVGTGVTEYFYSDRHAYEVVAVKDQKHISIREYDHKPIGEPMSNTWELISNESNHVYNLVKRGNYWYNEIVATIQDLEEYERAYANRENIELQLWWCNNGFDADYIRQHGCQKRYHKKNISIGIADYHYDYEF